MNLLSLVIFGLLGVILSRAFESPVEPNKKPPKIPWYSKLLNSVLICAVLVGVLVSLQLFPLGLVGLIFGIVLDWNLFDHSVVSS